MEMIMLMVLFFLVFVLFVFFAVRSGRIQNLLKNIRSFQSILY